MRTDFYLCHHPKKNTVEHTFTMVAHTFNPSFWEAEGGGSVQIKDQPSLHSELRQSQTYIVLPCHKNETAKNLNKQKTNTTKL